MGVRAPVFISELNRTCFSLQYPCEGGARELPPVPLPSLPCGLQEEGPCQAPRPYAAQARGYVVTGEDTVLDAVGMGISFALERYELVGDVSTRFLGFLLLRGSGKT